MRGVLASLSAFSWLRHMVCRSEKAGTRTESEREAQHGNEREGGIAAVSLSRQCYVFLFGVPYNEFIIANASITIFIDFGYEFASILRIGFHDRFDFREGHAPVAVQIQTLEGLPDALFLCGELTLHAGQQELDNTHNERGKATSERTAPALTICIALASLRCCDRGLTSS